MNMRTFTAEVLALTLLGILTCVSQTKQRQPWKIVRADSVILVQKHGSDAVDTIFVAENDSKANHQDEDDYDDDYYFDDTYHPLSLTGPYLSYRYSYEGSGGAHPIYGSWYRTIDLENRQEVSLDQIFDQRVILSVLLKDTLIQSHTTNLHPGTLAQLVESLDGGCEMSFFRFLKSFSIRSVNRDEVMIEFGLTHGCEVMRGNFTSFVITLPTSTALQEYAIE